MNQTKVKEVMIPLSDYATVSDEATIYEAILALEEAQKSVFNSYDRHRAILVLGRDNRIVGKVNLWDLLEGIEPRYKDLARPRELEYHGTGTEFARALLETYGLWSRPLEDICRNAADMRVREVMHPLGESEYIEENAPIDEAINQLVLGRYLSLLVTRDDDVIGVLRLSDIFRTVCNLIRQCRN